MYRNNVRSTRLSREPKMTAKELARAVTEAGHEVSESMIYQIERGEKKPSLELASAISKVLDQPIESLFFSCESTNRAIVAS